MIVLSMITKNSFEKVGEDFAKVWASSLQIPYKLIILVDDSDNDKTFRFVKDFADSYGKELIVLRSKLYGWHKPTRATARQTAIDTFFENTSEDWLFFLDDDFILGTSWWELARHYTEEHIVGLIWGIDYTPKWNERVNWIKARGLTAKDYAIYAFSIRGGLHDTLLRRQAIDGVKIPPWLHVYEDAWIKKYVECRGFQPVVIDVPGNMHLRASGEGYRKADLELMLKVSACLRLERVYLSSLLKTFFRLPGYIYYARKAGIPYSEGFRIWKTRVNWRFKHILWQLRCGDVNVCNTVSHGGKELEEKINIHNLIKLK